VPLFLECSLWLFSSWVVDSIGNYHIKLSELGVAWIA